MPKKLKDEIFCIYCQKDFGIPRKLRRHIERTHPDTYAYSSVNISLAKGKLDVTPTNQ